MTADRHVHVTIRGRVQGVWFRRWTLETATRLGLSGWVRNRQNGSVEAVFQGTTEGVQRMIGLCHQGPPAARVADVTVQEMTNSPSDTGFRTLQTV